MKYPRVKNELVAGAAIGIGIGAAMAFARDGSTLLLVDIDRDGLASMELAFK